MAFALSFSPLSFCYVFGLSCYFRRRARHLRVAIVIRMLAMIVPPILGLFRLGGALYLISPILRPIFLALISISPPNVSLLLRLKRLTVSFL